MIYYSVMIADIVVESQEIIVFVIYVMILSGHGMLVSCFRKVDLIFMNLLNQKLKAVQVTRAEAKKELKEEPDYDKRVKIARGIVLLNRQEREIIEELEDL